MTIQELRKKANLTQTQAATELGIPLRTYVRYENGTGGSEIKENYIIKKLLDIVEITETKGILTIDSIKETVSPILQKYDISLCYLFGSYAKNTQNEKSDVDLMIDSTITGLQFYGLVDELRTGLKKKVDLLRIDDAIANKTLLIEILKEGIKIYG